MTAIFYYYVFNYIPTYILMKTSLHFMSMKTGVQH